MASPLKTWLEQSLDSSRCDLEQSLDWRPSSFGGLEPPCYLLEGQNDGMQVTGISGWRQGWLLGPHPRMRPAILIFSRRVCDGVLIGPGPY